MQQHSIPKLLQTNSIIRNNTVPPSSPLQLIELYTSRDEPRALEGNITCARRVSRDNQGGEQEWWTPLDEVRKNV